MAEDLLRKLGLEYENINDDYLTDPDCDEEREARKLVLAGLKNLKIKRIQTVHNPFLQGMYQLKKMEYFSRYGEEEYNEVQEKMLLHATSEYSVDSIIEENLDWRRVTRAKFGLGTSFSDDADYANCHCNRNNGVERAFIIASVLVCKEENGEYDMEIPPDGVDTTVGNEKVWVKYHDNEFLPKYVVYYNSPSIRKSKWY